MLSRQRTAITQMQAIIAVVVIVAVVGAGAYFTIGGASSGTGTVYLSIVETDPVLQLNVFNPTNLTLTHDTTVTLAIQNGDDVARTFVISAFNVSEPIASGASARITFNVGQAGVYTMMLPPAPATSVFRASAVVTGYVIVT